MLSNAVLLDERVTFLSSSEGWTVTHAHGANRPPPSESYQRVSYDAGVGGVEFFRT